MTPFVLAFLLARHIPYHWVMSCQRFHEVTIEIMMDDKLDYRAKRQLIWHFRQKVEEKCSDVLI
jgi:hypothetical protein